MITLICLLSAFYLSVIFGLSMFNYEDNIYSFLVSILLITRGTLNYNYEHEELAEDDQYFIPRVGYLNILGFIILYHYVMRYFVIKISVAGLMSELNLARKEIMKEREKVELEKLKEQKSIKEEMEGKE